jgi:hypothetical protein
MLRTNASVIGITATGGKLGDPTSERWTNSLSTLAGNARLIHPYRSASFPSLGVHHHLILNTAAVRPELGFARYSAASRKAASRASSR